jgi:hypothetical protein
MIPITCSGWDLLDDRTPAHRAFRWPAFVHRRHRQLAVIGCLVAIVPTLVTAQTATPSPSPKPPPAVGELKALGQDRFQIGQIVVDKRARNFTVPGKVNLLDKPLEYLATSPGARKSYESLLELSASGSEINLACILIGLERDPALPAWKPSNPAAAGTRVTLSVAWSQGGQKRRISAAEALSNTQAGVTVESIEWSYTGSFTSLDGSQLAADVTGTLIGFVPDPTGIVAAASGNGLGPYGSVHGSSLLPPVGSAIELIVEPAKSTK